MQYEDIIDDEATLLLTACQKRKRKEKYQKKRERKNRGNYEKTN